MGVERGRQKDQIRIWIQIISNHPPGSSSINRMVDAPSWISLSVPCATSPRYTRSGSRVSHGGASRTWRRVLVAPLQKGDPRCEELRRVMCEAWPLAGVTELGRLDPGLLGLGDPR